MLSMNEKVLMKKKQVKNVKLIIKINKKSNKGDKWLLSYSLSFIFFNPHLFRYMLDIFVLLS